MKGERKTYKAMNFDLDTKQMTEKLGSSSKGYYLLRRTMKQLGFEHRQGSGYVSKQKIDSLAVTDVVSQLCELHEWLPDCIKKFDITNITSRQYSLLNEFFRAKQKVDERMAVDPIYALKIQTQRKQILSQSDAIADSLAKTIKPQPNHTPWNTR